MLEQYSSKSYRFFFEKNYKDHPAYNAIQETIYRLATQAGTVDAFKNFVRNEFFFSTKPSFCYY